MTIKTDAPECCADDDHHPTYDDYTTYDEDNRMIIVTVCQCLICGADLGTTEEIEE